MDAPCFLPHHNALFKFAELFKFNHTREIIFVVYVGRNMTNLTFRHGAMENTLMYVLIKLLKKLSLSLQATILDNH